jgi:hypothetical protein
MRDPARIDIVLSAVRRIWEQHPDLRLGQLLVIATRPKDPCSEVFNVEDESVLEGLAAYERQLQERP